MPNWQSHKVTWPCQSPDSTAGPGDEGGKGENKKKGMEWKEWDSNKFGRMSTPRLAREVLCLC